MLKRKEKDVFNPVMFLGQPVPLIIVRLLEMLTELTGSEVTFAQRFLMLFVCLYMEQLLACTKGNDKESDPVNADLGNNNQEIS